MDGDGTGARVAPITTTATGGAGRIRIVRRVPGTAHDRLCGPTGRATVAIGVIARSTIDLPTIPETGLAIAVRPTDLETGRATIRRRIVQVAIVHPHSRPSLAFQTNPELPDLRGRPRRIGRVGSPPDPGLRTSQEILDPQNRPRPAVPVGNRPNPEVRTSPVQAGRRRQIGPPEISRPRSRSQHLKIGLSRGRAGRYNQNHNRTTTGPHSRRGRRSGGHADFRHRFTPDERCAPSS